MSRFLSIRFSSTYFVLTRLLTYGTLGLTVQNRVNNFNTEVERLPEVSYNLSNQALGSSGFFLKNTSSYVNLVKKFARPSDVNLETRRLDTQSEVSYPMKIAFLEFKPFVGGEHTFYSRTINPEGGSSNHSVRPPRRRRRRLRRRNPRSP